MCRLCHYDVRKVPSPSYVDDIKHHIRKTFNNFYTDMCGP